MLGGVADHLGSNGLASKYRRTTETCGGYASQRSVCGPLAMSRGPARPLIGLGSSRRCARGRPRKHDGDSNALSPFSGCDPLSGLLDHGNGNLEQKHAKETKNSQLVMC